jgi:signal peptide peptidase SppA
MDRYAHVAQYVYSQPWAITPAKLAIILDLLAFRASGGRLSDEEIAERVGPGARSNAMTVQPGGAVAILPIRGTIAHHASMLAESSGGATTEGIAKRLREALADPQVASIVLDIDSPGGSVSGVPELAAEIYRSRGRKPLKAVANALAASAAYWIGTAADELIVTPSGEVGSVGVIAAHQDISEALVKEGVKVSLVTAGRYKAEGNPYQPLDEEARAELQRRVDEAYGWFVRDVARNRGVSVETVRSEFGEGRVYGGKEAVRRGMADRVATLDEVIAELASPRRAAGRSAESERARMLLTY